MKSRTINALVWWCVMVAVNAAVIVEGVRGGASAWSVVAGIVVFSAFVVTMGVCVDDLIKKLTKNK